MQVVGHTQILDFFDKVIKSGSLSHAYCFSGPEGVGKKMIARFLAARILNIDIEKLYLSPDFIFLERQFDEKSEKTKKDISVEQIRNLRESLSRSSFLNGYKIAIIDDAEKMNSESANALLKTLEEPRDKTIIFLITKDEKELPMTIISRCQMVYFHPVDRTEIEKYLLDSDCDSEKAKIFSSMSAGLPGKAISWFEDEASFENYKKEISRFLDLFGKEFYQKLKIVEELFDEKNDHVAGRGKLDEVLSLWQVLVRDIYFHKLNLSNYSFHECSSNYNFDLASLEEKMYMVRDLLKKNVHPRLLVEQILLALP